MNVYGNQIDDLLCRQCQEGEVVEKNRPKIMIITVLERKAKEQIGVGRVGKMGKEKKKTTKRRALESGFEPVSTTMLQLSYR